MLRLALSRRAFAAHFDPRADHLRFYTPRTLTRLLDDFGFRASVSVRARRQGRPARARLLLAAARCASRFVSGALAARHRRPAAPAM